MSSESLQESAIPSCSIASIKKRAKMIRIELNPEGAITLTALHSAVGRCLGLDYYLVFSHRQSATPLFPKNLPPSEWENFQRRREITVLTELLPHIAPALIEKFVSKWRLVKWPHHVRFESSSLTKVLAARPLPEKGGRQPFASTAHPVSPKDHANKHGGRSTINSGPPPERFVLPSQHNAHTPSIADYSVVDSLRTGVASHVAVIADGYADWQKAEASVARLLTDNQFPSWISVRRSTQVHVRLVAHSQRALERLVHSAGSGAPVHVVRADALQDGAPRGSKP